MDETKKKELRERLQAVRAADAQVLEAKEQAKVARAAKPKEPNTCLCGCGGTTMSRFVPGHDAKLKSRLLTEAHSDDDKVAEEALMRLDELGWAHFFVPRTKPDRKTVAA